MKNVSNIVMLLMLTCIYFGLTGTSFSQVGLKSESWEDGVPTFVKTHKDFGIVIGEQVTLEPVREFITDDTLKVTLDGLDWHWPTDIPIGSAEDVDWINLNDQDLYLVTDRLNHKVFLYNSDVKATVWSFGSDKVTDLNYLDRPVASQIFQDEDGSYKILIADAGRNRVIRVDQLAGNIDWQYGDSTGFEGVDDNQLSNPEDAVKIPGKKEYLIADRGNNRVIIADEATHTNIWQIGPDSLNAPIDVDYLDSTSEILITDRGNNRVIVVNRDSHQIVWQFGGKRDTSLTTGLKTPSDADFLANGNILIADEGNDRIIEVSREGQTGQIVWQFNRTFNGLKDVDRLPNNKHIAVYFDPALNNSVPAGLGYKNSSVVSEIYDLNREINFNQLFWQADTLAGVTSIRFQLRAANSLSDLDVAKWIGPTGDGSYYETPGDTINSIHDGKRFFQFKAFLTTNNPLFSPLLKTIQLTYQYYSTDTRPWFWTDHIPIGDSTKNLVSQWKTLEFKTKLPDDPDLRQKIDLEVQINDANPPNKVLASFPASKTNPDNIFSLESNTSLQGVQSIFLFAYASTSNSSVTPILDSWKITYDIVPAVLSNLYFSDRAGKDVDYFRATTSLPATEDKVDSLDVFLYDPDQEPFNPTISIQVTTALSGDSEKVTLTSQGAGVYRVVPRIPILISDNFTVDNQIMEVKDRDSLFVHYTDISNPNDISADTILVIKNTPGELVVENENGKIPTKVNFGESLFARVKNEQDRNINPTLQDSIQVQFINVLTFDREDVTLYEVADESGVYNTGEFASRDGIFVVNSENGVKNDGKLQALPGQLITIEYDDNIKQTKSLQIPENAGTFVTIYLGGAPYVAEVAPNPFYESKYNDFKLRVASATGTMTVRKLEIYNIAGEKVREIDGNMLRFNVSTPIPKEKYGIADHWWDLRSDSGHQVASGTYFLKLHADLFHEDTNDFEQVTYIRKFVVIR